MVAYATCGSVLVWSENCRGTANVYGAGQILQEDDMKFLLQELRSAGKHLSRVMKPIHELEKSGWVGKIWEVKI